MFDLGRKIILASQSPRRKQLLAEAGFSFDIYVTNIEENYPDDMPVDEVPEFLARKKAQAALTQVKDSELIIASDCVVILEGKIYEKPRDYDDAVRILSALSGKMHRVVTGVCLLTKEKEVSFSCEAKVYFEPLSSAEIDFYIKNYKPYDKAGAYAIQEWIGLCKISKIEGTYANIMGLPMQMVYEKLKVFKL